MVHVPLNIPARFSEIYLCVHASGTAGCEAYCVTVQSRYPFKAFSTSCPSGSSELTETSSTSYLSTTSTPQYASTSNSSSRRNQSSKASGSSYGTQQQQQSSHSKPGRTGSRRPLSNTKTQSNGYGGSIHCSNSRSIGGSSSSATGGYHRNSGVNTQYSGSSNCSTYGSYNSSSTLSSSSYSHTVSFCSTTSTAASTHRSNSSSSSLKANGYSGLPHPASVSGCGPGGYGALAQARGRGKGRGKGSQLQQQQWQGQQAQLIRAALPSQNAKPQLHQQQQWGQHDLHAPPPPPPPPIPPPPRSASAAAAARAGTSSAQGRQPSIQCHPGEVSNNHAQEGAASQWWRLSDLPGRPRVLGCSYSCRLLVLQPKSPAGGSKQQQGLQLLIQQLEKCGLHVVQDALGETPAAFVPVLTRLGWRCGAAAEAVVELAEAVVKRAEVVGERGEAAAEAGTAAAMVGSAATAIRAADETDDAVGTKTAAAAEAVAARTLAAAAAEAVTAAVMLGSATTAVTAAGEGNAAAVTTMAAAAAAVVAISLASVAGDAIDSFHVESSLPSIVEMDLMLSQLHMEVRERQTEQQYILGCDRTQVAWMPHNRQVHGRKQPCMPAPWLVNRIFFQLSHANNSEEANT